MNNNTGSSVFVELSTLTDWSSRIDVINENAISTLNSLISTIEDLNNYWVGNIPTGFIEDSSSLIKSVQKCHNDMKGVATFLIEVVNKMDSQ